MRGAAYGGPSAIRPSGREAVAHGENEHQAECVTPWGYVAIRPAASPASRALMPMRSRVARFAAYFSSTRALGSLYLTGFADFNSLPQNIPLITIIAINVTTNAPITVTSVSHRRNVARSAEFMRGYSSTTL